MESATYMVLKVLDRVTKREILIKEHRFNPEFHVKIEGETPHEKSYFIHPNLPIILDPIQAAVEAGKKKAAEDAASPKSAPEDTDGSEGKVPEGEDPEASKAADDAKDGQTAGSDAVDNGGDEAGTGEGDSQSPYANLTKKDLQTMCKDKGIAFTDKNTKAELLEMLSKS